MKKLLTIIVLISMSVGFLMGSRFQIMRYKQNTQNIKVQVNFEKQTDKNINFDIKRFDWDNLYGFYVEYPTLKKLICEIE